MKLQKIQIRKITESSVVLLCDFKSKHVINPVLWYNKDCYYGESKYGFKYMQKDAAIFNCGDRYIRYPENKIIFTEVLKCAEKS